MDSDKLIEKRFIAVLVAMLAATGMLWANRIGAPNFEQIIIWVTGLFLAGSTSDKWASSVMQKKDQRYLDKAD